MMSNGRDFSNIVEAARTHYMNLKTDITNAATRLEHVRLTALAQEAHNLLTDLIIFETGLVYSHTANADPYFQTETLDIPEFKTPYNPDLQ